MPNDPSSATRELQYKTIRGFSMNLERRPALAAAHCWASWESSHQSFLLAWPKRRYDFGPKFSLVRSVVSLRLGL